MSKQTLLSTKMAADQLGFTANWIRRMILSGYIKAERVGHEWLIKPKDLAHVIKRRKPNKE